MVMKLYCAPNTGNCMRAILALFDAKVDVNKEVKLLLVDIDKGDQTKREYLDKNPLGRVPCLEVEDGGPDGDLIVFESRAISRFLAEKHPHEGGPFLGNTPEERATINQWCEVEGQAFMPAVKPIFRELHWFAIGKSTKEKVEEVMRCNLPEVEKVLDIYEAQLSNFDHLPGEKYITGDKYTLADAFPTPYLYKLMNLEREVFGDREHVIKWAKSLINGTAFQKTLQLEKGSKWEKE